MLNQQIDVTEMMLIQTISHCVEAIHRLAKNKKYDEFTREAIGGACLAKKYLLECAQHKKNAALTNNWIH